MKDEMQQRKKSLPGTKICTNFVSVEDINKKKKICAMNRSNEKSSARYNYILIFQYIDL